jgi:glutaminyl-peptide cyclotransferase
MNGRQLLLLIALVIGGCDADPVALLPALEPARALTFVQEITAIGPRASGSEGARKTVQYIADQAKAWGYDPVLDTWTEATPRGRVEFTNVTATLAGDSESYIIIGTHFDTKILDSGKFVGANDGGSSTGLVLELMRTLHGSLGTERPALMFAFFDGEECYQNYTSDDGLHGSKRLAQQLKQSGKHKNCIAMILLDMIGDSDLTVTISPNDDKKLRELLFDVTERQGTRQHFGYFMQGSILDDHVPFKQIGIPALDIIDFKYGPNNSYWHTDRDTLDKVSAESLSIVGNAVIQMIYDLQSQ